MAIQGTIRRVLDGSIASALFAFALAVSAAPATAENSSEPPPLDSALLDQLRAGGFVIYLRHAPTELNDIPDSSANIAKCETQRNLSAQGKKIAKDIGLAFNKLKIPVGVVKSSPFCRCKDTARLAFGRYAIDRTLYFAFNIEANARQQLTEALRKALATPPAPGANTVIVSHSVNLREATGYWPKPEGVAYIFRPEADGKFTPVARMAPDEWQTLLSAGRRP